MCSGRQAQPCLRNVDRDVSGMKPSEIVILRTLSNFSYKFQRPFTKALIARQSSNFSIENYGVPNCLMKSPDKAVAWNGIGFSRAVKAMKIVAA